MNDGEILIYEREYSQFAFGPWKPDRREMRRLPDDTEPEPEWSTPCLYSNDNSEKTFMRERTAIYKRVEVSK